MKVEGQHNTDNTAVHEKEDNDIVVIDLEEDPELKYKSSPDTDIGQLVACLVLDAKRNNTLPRSRSRITVSSEADTASLNQSPAAIPVADQDDKVEDSVPREEVASPSIADNDTVEEEELSPIIEDSGSVSSSHSEVLETSFDDNLEMETSTEDVKVPAAAAPNPYESLGESSFYNGIMQATEFLVTASFSEELFKEETTSSSESSQLDQDGFTDVNKVNTTANEDEELSAEENNDQGNNDKCEEDYENVTMIGQQEQNDTDPKKLINNDLEEPSTDILISFSHLENVDENMKHENIDLGTENKEEDNSSCGALEEVGCIGNLPEVCVEEDSEDEKEDKEDECATALHPDESLLNDSENEFESIAKISALDFLNEEDDTDEDVTDVGTNTNNYFSSSFLFNHPIFSKESSFPSLKVEREDNSSSSPYLEAINLELDTGKQSPSPWNPFSRYSTVELRVNPIYKDEDSLNSNNSLILAESKTPQQFNYNFQEFFDLWEMFSKDQDEDGDEEEDEEVIGHHLQNSTCSLIFNNLEAIQEEDELEEDSESEVDENNNFDDYEDSEEDEEITGAVISEHKNPAIDRVTENHDPNVPAENNHEKPSDSEGPCNADYFDIFKVEPDIFEYVQVKEHDYQSSLQVETFVDDLLNSILHHILETEKMVDDENVSTADELDVDDEYYSCDSPDDLQSDHGSGVSTDEGIDATDDDEYDIDNKDNHYKHELKISRNSPTQL